MRPLTINQEKVATKCPDLSGPDLLPRFPILGVVPNSNVVCLLNVKHSFVQISPSQYILPLHGSDATPVHFLLESLPVFHLNLVWFVDEDPTPPLISDFLLPKVMNKRLTIHPS